MYHIIVPSDYREQHRPAMIIRCYLLLNHDLKHGVMAFDSVSKLFVLLRLREH